jgi:hypothetical protein
MANDEDGPGRIGHGQLVLHLCQDNGIYIPVQERNDILVQNDQKKRDIVGKIGIIPYQTAG